MDVKTRIIEKATELFIKSGIRRVTMDILSEELGISKRTIYENFTDKDEIIYDSIFNLILAHKSEIKKLIARSDNTIEAIIRIIRYSELKYSDTETFSSELKKYYPNVVDRLRKNGEMNDGKILLQLIRQGMAEGLFHHELTPELVVAFFQGKGKLASMHDGINNNRFTREQVYQSIIRPYVVGICTPKGKKLIKDLDDVVFGNKKINNTKI
ncbi:MAG: TetR/AcrR family transcriptional regulator [Bacteroidales bacterium]|nr:TetR/AcrR family transcriptional regulator [Bacteroidales bacterium]